MREKCRYPCTPARRWPTTDVGTALAGLHDQAVATPPAWVRARLAALARYAHLCGCMHDNMQAFMQRRSSGGKSVDGQRLYQHSGRTTAGGADLYATPDGIAVGQHTPWKNQTVVYRSHASLRSV